MNYLLSQLQGKSSHKAIHQLNSWQPEDIYEEILLPKMQTVFIFLKEVVNHLNYLEKAVQVLDYSSKFPKIGPLIQKNYQLNTDGFGGFCEFDNIKQINLTFVCANQGSFSYDLQGQSIIEQEIQFLSTKNIPFKQNKRANGGVQLTITRQIPVRFRFEVDLIQAKIKLLIHNHQDFNRYHKAFLPNDINEVLLNKIIRFLLRKDLYFIHFNIETESQLDIPSMFPLPSIDSDESYPTSKLLDRISLFSKRKSYVKDH